MEEEEEKNEEKEEEEQQQVCPVCGQMYVDPMVTKCGHIFCEKCIKGKMKCDLCGEATGGTFNSARKLLNKRRN
jgi:RING finger protein 113A